MLLKLTTTFCILVLADHLVCSQDTTKQIFTPLVNEVIDLDPGKVSENKVKIANFNQVQINEAPGSVYVITADDIEKHGYRDLTEVLIDIPGFNIATDVQNGTGIAVRGAWASEAKILVMIDGMIMNDMSYGSFIVGGRIPLLNVERIEIIRGASSSIYGGIAGLGVINIITKEGNYSKNSSFMFDSGFSGDELSGTRLTFANTSYLLNDFELSLSGSIYSGNRSNQKYLHPDSTMTDFSDSSRVDEAFLQMNLKRKSFSYKLLYNDYNFQATHDGIYSQCRTFMNDFSFDKKFGKFYLNSGINLKEQIPWNTQYGDPLIYDLQNLKTRRVTLNTTTNFEISNKLNALVGVVYYNDFMRYYRPHLILNTGNTSESFHAFAGFAEFSFKTKYFNLFAGGRADLYESFDPNFSPRISITKEFKFWHYKLIYGESFKIPTLQNINLAWFNTERIKPEKIEDYQIELGFKNANHFINVGAFYTRIQDVIVYGYDLGTYTESYVNNGDISYAGTEIAMQNKFNKFTLKTGYAYYELMQSTGNDFLADTADIKVGALAIPKHKVTARFLYDLNDKNTISLNYIFQSSRRSVEQINATTEEYAYLNYDPTHLVDLIFQSRGIFKVVDLTAGVKNILNTRNHYTYPMSGGYATSMGMGREIFVQIKLNL
jgi:outer membrane receptor for ferrienterochelin and colicin